MDCFGWRNALSVEVGPKDSDSLRGMIYAGAAMGDAEVGRVG